METTPKTSESQESKAPAVPTAVAPTPQKPKIVFVAIYPREKRIPAYLKELSERGWVVTHPAFDWESTEGVQVQGIIKKAKGLDLPNAPDPWLRTSLRDYFAVQAADTVVYDADSEPGTHFLAAAQIFRVPVVAVSATLMSIPAYFSGAVKYVIKPQNLLQNI
jgi:hypothetical protein